MTTTQLDSAIREVARTHRMFTVDDVWQATGAYPKSRREGSRIGPAIQNAKAQGLIEPTGTYLRSARGPAHGNLMTVWRSVKR